MRRNILVWAIYRIFGERVGDLIVGSLVAALGVLATLAAVIQRESYWWVGLVLMALGGIFILIRLRRSSAVRYRRGTYQVTSPQQRNFYGQPQPGMSQPPQQYAAYPQQPGAPYVPPYYSPYSPRVGAPYPPPGAPDSYEQQQDNNPYRC